MPSQFLSHDGTIYATLFTYALPDGAWYLELSRAVPGPAEWLADPRAPRHLPGVAVATAVVPDQDSTREPVIRFSAGGEAELPYEVIRWFVSLVEREVEDVRSTRASAEDGS